MTVKHVLKNGTQVIDLTGHIVRMDENNAVYALIREMQSKTERNEQHGNL